MKILKIDRDKRGKSRKYIMVKQIDYTHVVKIELNIATLFI